MPKNRKYFPHKSVLFVTSRTEEGLPLVPTHNLNFIIYGILAKAGTMYDVKVCHFLFMSNHFHMILVVQNPEHVSEYMRYVKGEIAHAINLLLGRRQRTIWKHGYDSPILLTSDDVLRYINYIYLNPVKAGLVDSIDDYPGVSSWNMYISGRYAHKYKHLRRTSIDKLISPALPVNEQKRIVEHYSSDKVQGFEQTLVIEPYAWVDSFAGDISIEEAKLYTLSKIKEEQSLYKSRRDKPVIGQTALRRGSMIKDHTPNKHTRRMICICYDKEYRKGFIEHFKSLCEMAKVAYESWKKGDFSIKIPPGLFSPRPVSLASALPV